MAYKSLQCPNCLGQIDTFDETTKMGTCPFCHSVIEKVPDLQRLFEEKIFGTVKVDGIDNAEDQIERALGFVRLGELDEAEKLLDQYTAKYPMDFEGWRQLYELSKGSLDDGGINPNDDALYFMSAEAESKTKNLAKEQKKALRCIKNMALLASDDEQRQWVKGEKAEFEKKRDEEKPLVDGLDRRIADMKSKAKSLASRVNREEEGLRKAEASLSESKKRRDGRAIQVLIGVVCAAIGIALSGSSGSWFPMMIGGLAIGAFVTHIILVGAVSSDESAVEASKKKVEAARSKESKAMSDVVEADNERAMKAKPLELYSQAVDLFEKA